MPLPNEKYLVWDGLHAGVEPTGGLVIDAIEHDPIEGVCTYRLDEEAVRQGVRYRGTCEKGMHFRDEVLDAEYGELDPDQAAVRDFMFDDSVPNLWGGLDLHTSPQRNANALVIGEETNPVMLGIASVLGLRNVVIIQNYPFFEMCPNMVSVETTLDPENNPLSDPEYWHGSIQTIMKLGEAGLAALSQNDKRHFKYFRLVDLMRVRDDGAPDEQAIELIQELETIPDPGACFSPLILPHKYREYLGAGNSRVYTSSWGDNNNSPERPDMLGYTDDGKARRVCFGAVMIEMSDFWNPWAGKLVRDYLMKEDYDIYRNTELSDMLDAAGIAA